MDASEYLIVLCSPRSAVSPWVNHEIAWFKTHRDATRILTLIVDGEPGAAAIPGREAEECFPKTLLFKVGADLQPTDQSEHAPLAADARETGDGKRGAKLKIAAAMLGVGYDALVNRDTRRRAERRRLVYAGLGSLSLVLSGLSVFAFTQRDAAVAARIKAEAAEKNAKFQADEAQSLVEFMLTDFRKELDSLGRLDVLERTGKRLLESFAKQDVAKLDANALGRRARVLLLLGEVDNTRGNLDAALARYKEAAATTEELLRRNPGSAQQIFDHAQSVFWVGYIAWQRGDAKEAKKYWAQYREYADRLVAIDPDKDEWQMEVGYAVNNLGILAMDQGEAVEAERNFREYLRVSARLAERQPEDRERLINLGQAYAWLADALHRQAKLEEAKLARRGEIQGYEAWLAKHASDANIRRAAGVAKYRLAQIEIALGMPEVARNLAEKATRDADQLLADDPKSMERAEGASLAHAILGEAYFYLELFDDARKSLATSIEIAERLVAHDDSVAQWKGQNLAFPRLILARIMGNESDFSGAESLYGLVTANLNAIIENGAADPIIMRRYCAALAGRARLNKSFYGDWLEITARLAPTTAKLGPEALALLAEAYARTGKDEEARAIVSKLYAAGFRHPDFMAMLEEFPGLAADARKPASGE